ncbi:hypothetical protein KKB11_03005, partial [Candidatus Micrarchaeota archaeon]|nr:hypothetical protein [Candidatus Micrarchaeota archaeon]
MTKFYSLSIEETLKELNTGMQGLTDKQAFERKEKFGLNKITETKKTTKLEILVNQFKSFIIWILIIASVISFFIGETVDAIV